MKTIIISMVLFASLKATADSKFCTKLWPKDNVLGGQNCLTESEYKHCLKVQAKYGLSANGDDENASEEVIYAFMGDPDYAKCTYGWLNIKKHFESKK